MKLCRTGSAGGCKRVQCPHHSACKSAVIHAETLLKLARWSEDDLPSASAEAPADDVLALLNEARAELDGFNDDED